MVSLGRNESLLWPSILHAVFYGVLARFDLQNFFIVLARDPVEESSVSMDKEIGPTDSRTTDFALIRLQHTRWA